MKIFVSHSKNSDYINELYHPIRNSTLNIQHEFTLPHEDGSAINTKDVIKNSDLVLAEVSLPGTGQGIELGWADAFGVPIICMSKTGTEISRSLKYITDKFLTYGDLQDMVNKIELEINKI